MYHFDILDGYTYLRVILKLDYENYLMTSIMLRNCNMNSENLVILKDPETYRVIKDILKLNTSLNFENYIIQDKSIWNFLFPDIMNGMKFTSEVKTLDYNPKSINMVALKIIHDSCPNVYGYVARYTKYIYGPFLFLEAVRNMRNSIIFNDMDKNCVRHGLRNEYDYFREIDNALVHFMNTGKLETSIKFQYVVPMIECSGLWVLLAVHILQHSSPGDVSVTDFSMSSIAEFMQSIRIYKDDPVPSGFKCLPSDLVSYNNFAEFWEDIYKDIVFLPYRK